MAGGDRAGGDARRRHRSAATLERGRQLAAAGDCAVCHTASEGATNAGGLAMATPFGTLYSTNITPDVATGIGNWSFTAFDRAMRRGIARDGRHLYPAFPYTAFSKMTDGDMQALYAYLMSQPAVRQSNPANQMRFPFNLRPLMAGWNALFLRRGISTRSATKRAVESRRLSGQRARPLRRLPFAAQSAGGRKGRRGFPAGDGGRMGSAGAESIGQCGQARTEEQLFQYFRSGHSAEHGVAAGPMGPVVSELATLPQSDLRAMANYVMSLSTKATLNVEPQAQLAARALPAAGQLAGERLFQGACRLPQCRRRRAAAVRRQPGSGQ